MKPGELVCAAGDIALNAGREALEFDRAAAHGQRLNIAAGTAVRFEPGQKRAVSLIKITGGRRVFGFNAKIMGDL